MEPITELNYHFFDDVMQLVCEVQCLRPCARLIGIEIRSADVLISLDIDDWTLVYVMRYMPTTEWRREMVASGLIGRLEEMQEEG